MCTGGMARKRTRKVRTATGTNGAGRRGPSLLLGLSTLVDSYLICLLDCSTAWTRYPKTNLPADFHRPAVMIWCLDERS